MSNGSRTRRPLVLGALVCLGSLLLLVRASALQQVSIPRPVGSSYEGRAFTFHEMAPDVYHAVGTGALTVGCNAAVIVDERDVLVVDTHISPAAGWALIEEIKTLTPKPVRWVVNTHFHFDHVHGNQVFPAGVEIIGHELTRAKIAAGDSMRGRSYESFVGTLPDRIAAMRERAAALVEMNARQELEREIAIQERHLAATRTVEPVAPTVTLDRSMTLYRGDREIRLLHLGRGHTAGDVVVYLPAERVVITGDLIINGLSYLGDGYPEDWVETLERLKALDFEVVVPGHGAAFSDRGRIDAFQDYLRDFWTQVTALHADGVSAAEAAGRIDMRRHADHFPTIQDVGISTHSVDRAYGLLEGTEE